MDPSDKITKDLKGLEEYSPITAGGYYNSLEAVFDKKYGKGWSKEHSETIAMLSLACARDFHTMMLCKTLQQSTEDICQKLDWMALQLENIGRNIG